MERGGETISQDVTEGLGGVTEGLGGVPEGLK